MTTNVQDLMGAASNDGMGGGVIPPVARAKLGAWLIPTPPRLLGLGIGVLASAAVMIGMSAAHADTPDEVMEQATNDLAKGDSVLAGAPTTGLHSDVAQFVDNEATLGTQLDHSLTQIGSMQENLPAVDQPFLTNADEQLVTAAQNVLSADQALVAADHGGELTGFFPPAEFNAIDANFGLVSADFTAIGDTMLAQIFPDIGSFIP